MESKILELQKMVSRYKTTWSQIQEQMNEFTLVYVARWRGKDGKRYASPFKTKDSAEKKAKELKSKGNSEVSVTQDTLRGNIKFKSDNSPDIKGMQKEESIKEDGHDDVSSSKRMAQVIGEDAQLILQELDKKSNEESLPTWWTNKLATSAHNMNAARDYISNDIKESSDGYTLKEFDMFAKDKKAAAKGNFRSKEDAEREAKRTGGTVYKASAPNSPVPNWRVYFPKKKNEELEEAMSDAQLKKVRDSYKDLKTISPEKVKTLRNFLDRYSTDSLMQLAQANINFVSTMARSVMNKRKMGDPKHAGSMREEAKSDMEKIADLRTRQMVLQTKLKDMDPGDPKDKTPMAITKNDIENIQMKMDQIRQKPQKEEVHPAKALVEAIKAVKNKSEKTGMPYSILKKVYDRGMAAWKGGHRPGTTPQQWALARVNSFVTKSSGTWGGADSDLAKKVRSKK